MNILFLCNSYPPAIGGAEKAAETIVSILRKEHGVHIITQPHPNRKSSDDPLVAQFPARSSYSVMDQLPKFLEDTKDHYDCYFVFGFAKYFSDFTLKWAKKNGKLSVFMPVGFFHTNSQKVFKWIYSKFIAPGVMKTADVILTATQWEADFWKNKYNITEDKFVIIPHNINKNFERFNPTNIIEKNKLKEKNYILYFGRAGPNKLISLLIKAYISISPKEKLIIAGLNTDNEILKSNANRHGEQITSIKFLGEVSEDDKKTLISKAKLCIFPSSYESYGLFVVECSRLRSPLILSNIPPFRELVKDNRLFFENDIESLAQRLEIAIKNPICPIVKEQNQEQLLLNEFKALHLSRRDYGTCFLAKTSRTKK